MDLQCNLVFGRADVGKKNFTHQSSRRLKSQRLLRCLDSCFCLTFSDVVLVTSPHPPRPTLECVYIMHVCVYICVFISTPYMYTYTYAVYVTCGEKSAKIPLKVVTSLPYYTLSSLGISNDPQHPPRKNLRGDTESCTSSVQPFLSVG